MTPSPDIRTISRWLSSDSSPIAIPSVVSHLQPSQLTPTKQPLVIEWLDNLKFKFLQVHPVSSIQLWVSSIIQYHPVSSSIIQYHPVSSSVQYHPSLHWSSITTFPLSPLLYSMASSASNIPKGTRYLHLMKRQPSCSWTLHGLGLLIVVSQT